MDGLRLIRTTRHALAEARSVADVLVEAWQACQLTEAVGTVVAAGLDGRGGYGDAAERAAGRVAYDEPWLGDGAAELARALADAGSHAGGCVGRPPDDWTGVGRASRLTVVSDPPAALRELRGLIHETAEAMIVLACGADDQELYWRCIDAVDAAAECKELVTDLLRALGQRIPVEGPDGAPAKQEETVVLELPAPPPG
jgi:hypothetical protein